MLHLYSISLPYCGMFSLCTGVRSPSCGMILSVTVRPASLISLTMSACGMLTIDWEFTASILSPTFSFPQRSAGLPSMMRPILCGTAATHHAAGKRNQWAAPDGRIVSVFAHTTNSLTISLSLSFCCSLQAYVRLPGFFHRCVGDVLMLTAAHQRCLWVTCCGRPFIIEEIK